MLSWMSTSGWQQGVRSTVGGYKANNWNSMVVLPRVFTAGTVLHGWSLSIRKGRLIQGTQKLLCHQTVCESLAPAVTSCPQGLRWLPICGHWQWQGTDLGRQSLSCCHGNRNMEDAQPRQANFMLNWELYVICKNSTFSISLKWCGGERHTDSSRKKAGVSLLTF